MSGFTRNWELKVIALLLAVLLWVALRLNAEAPLPFVSPTPPTAPSP